MAVTYYKRFRMEADLRHPWRPPGLPEGYRFVPWSPARLLEHAEAKQLSFEDEIDSEVFDALASLDGCRSLMQEISRKPGFLPEATWLIEYSPGHGQPEPVGTIQGLRVSPRLGAIQTVGVTPWHRARGIGSALVQAALFGFQSVGIERASLEVTAHNTPAIRLYESLGFRCAKTNYRAVDDSRAALR